MVVHGPPAMVQVRLKDDEATIEAVATLNEKVLHLPKVRAEVRPKLEDEEDMTEAILSSMSYPPFNKTVPPSFSEMDPGLVASIDYSSIASHDLAAYSHDFSFTYDPDKVAAAPNFEEPALYTYFYCNDNVDEYDASHDFDSDVDSHLSACSSNDKPTTLAASGKVPNVHSRDESLQRTPSWPCFSARTSPRVSVPALAKQLRFVSLLDRNDLSFATDQRDCDECGSTRFIRGEVREDAPSVRNDGDAVEVYVPCDPTGEDPDSATVIIRVSSTAAFKNTPPTEQQIWDDVEDTLKDERLVEETGEDVYEVRDGVRVGLGLEFGLLFAPSALINAADETETELSKEKNEEKDEAAPCEQLPSDDRIEVNVADPQNIPEINVSVSRHQSFGEVEGSHDTTKVDSEKRTHHFQNPIKGKGIGYSIPALPPACSWFFPVTSKTSINSRRTMSDCAPIVHCPVKEEAAPGGSGPAVPIESGDRFVLPSNCTNQGVADTTAMSMSLGAFIGTALENGALCFGSHIFMAFTGDAGPNGGTRAAPVVSKCGTAASSTDQRTEGLEKHATASLDEDGQNLTTHDEEDAPALALSLSKCVDLDDANPPMPLYREDELRALGDSKMEEIKVVKVLAPIAPIGVPASGGEKPCTREIRQTLRKIADIVHTAERDQYQPFDEPEFTH